MNNETKQSTNTIRVIVRHGLKCKGEDPGLGEDYRVCNCRKSFYIRENGRHNAIFRWNPSLGRGRKGRTGGENKRDPVKRKVKELEERVAAMHAPAPAAGQKHSDNRR